MNERDLRYPIGRRPDLDPSDEAVRRDAIASIAGHPAKLRAVVSGLSVAQLDTPYRDGGWTARQVVHHLADSHLHAYLRCTWALTEDGPTIKGYDPAVWADIPDARSGPVEPSLTLLDGLHQRWVARFASLDAGDFERAWTHPTQGRRITIGDTLLTYAWHGDHHLAHIEVAKHRHDG
ncbi:MAG: putative metal-dependent hydrolase [Trueperaceae bacterium]|nr:putative metal-dependent hydrolase [Trueperaceae bacterium]